MSKWIPRTEELPQDWTPILVSLEHETFPMIGYYCQPTYEGERARWINDDGEEFLSKYGENVLAWMPLPEPYTEDVNDNV